MAAGGGWDVPAILKHSLSSLWFSRACVITVIEMHARCTLNSQLRGAGRQSNILVWTWFICCSFWTILLVKLPPHWLIIYNHVAFYMQVIWSVAAVGVPEHRTELCLSGVNAMYISILISDIPCMMLSRLHIQHFIWLSYSFGFWSHFMSLPL